MSSQRSVALLLLVLTAAGLAAAYVLQYGFGLEPCPLCLYQRYPYFAAIAVLVIGLVVARPAPALALALLLYALDAGIALYHTGVEAGLFSLPSSCGAEAAADSLDALRAQVLATPIPRCDQPAALFLGLSIAAWNALFALFLAALSLFGLRLSRRASAVQA